ncbi:hypothetical protein [Aliivibrio finisterrensis]|uniref:hypothetical protein n=1 Tax=Aliivibrio finisterrensis TaxID=511998 RepID=UPI001FCAD235|nr:hypothetical protein [Aliivibrio finisterrensis]
MESVFFTLSCAHIQIAGENDENFNDCVPESVDCHEEEVFNDEHLKCNEQVYLEIKQAILAKEVKPSQRGIGERLKGEGRDTINFVLMDLKHAGFLRSYRKGYAFA